MSIIDEKQFTDDINAEWRLQHQLLNCEKSISNEEMSFERNVDMVMRMLPVDIRNSVKARKEDYTYVPEPEYKFIYSGGIRLGSIERPLFDDEGFLISPIKIELDEAIDYSILYQIILEELEIANMSYKYRIRSTILTQVVKKKKEPKPLLLEEEEDV